jgi:hypothetical protein
MTRRLVNGAIQTLGEGRFAPGDEQQVVGTTDLLLNGLTRPHDHSWSVRHLCQVCERITAEVSGVLHAEHT